MSLEQGAPVRFERAARAGSGPQRELAGEARGHPLEVAVPAAAHAARRVLATARHGDHLLVERVEWRQEERAQVGRDQPERLRDGEVPADRHDPEVGQVGARDGRQRELRVLVTEAAQPRGRAAGCARGGHEARKGHGRIVHRAGRDARERLARLDAEHEQRALAIGAHGRGHRQRDARDRELETLELAEIVAPGRALTRRELRRDPAAVRHARAQRPQPVALFPRDTPSAVPRRNELEAAARFESHGV